MNSLFLSIAILLRPVPPAHIPIDQPYPDPSIDLQRFPSLETARATEDYISDLGTTFERKQKWSNRSYWEWSNAVIYCHWSRECWDTLRAAHQMQQDRWQDLGRGYNQSLGEAGNRQYWLDEAGTEGEAMENDLKDLRKLLGEEAWWAGRMPFPAPLFAMESIP